VLRSVSRAIDKLDGRRTRGAANAPFNSLVGLLGICLPLRDEKKEEEAHPHNCTEFVQISEKEK
jgi:hypothetical protein